MERRSSQNRARGTCYTEYPETVVLIKLGRCFTGDNHTAHFCLDDGFDLFASRDMSNMNVPRVTLAKPEHLRYQRTFAMNHNWTFAGPRGNMCFDQRPINESQRAEGRIDINLEPTCIPGCLCYLFHIICRRAQVDANIAARPLNGQTLLSSKRGHVRCRGSCIRHVKHSSHSAGQCCGRTTGIRFLVFSARLSKMNMHINQSWECYTCHTGSFGQKKIPQRGSDRTCSGVPSCILTGRIHG